MSDKNSDTRIEVELGTVSDKNSDTRNEVDLGLCRIKIATLVMRWTGDCVG